MIAIIFLLCKKQTSVGGRGRGGTFDLPFSSNNFRVLVSENYSNFSNRKKKIENNL